MLDLFLGATIQVLLDKALSPVIDWIGSVPRFHKDLESFRKSVVMIKAVLADAEVKQTVSPAVQSWLETLKIVAFDAVILLDELNYEFLRRKVNPKKKGKVLSYIEDEFFFRWGMAAKVEEMNTKLKKINQEAIEIGLVSMATAQTSAVASNRQTDSLAAPNVVGRDKDESKIVEILLRSSETVVSVLPMVGMAGLGKTTLAKSVYNNPKIHKHFDEKIWVCVSGKFDVIGLFKLILESLTRNGEFASRDNVVQKIRKELEGKRYLLVLDDVWNENQKLWDDFFDSLVGINTTHGNKCLVTTRLQKVASIVSPHDVPYMLGKLTEDECFSIIKGKVVQSGEIPGELILIREKVIKKCGGLPLAAKVIGGLLLLQRKEIWPKIVERMPWISEGPENDGIMQTLKLSFDHLPSPSIKKCFTYCSLFSKGARIDRDFLIELWMAEGFLQTNSPDKMEETGGEYHDILVQSSLLENLGFRNYYAMHDLVHDLSQALSEPHSLASYQVRHLALDTSAEINDTSALISKSSSISDEMLLKFKHLLTLNLSKANISELPSTIGELKHLRFLTISNSKIKSLPESVCNLYNLQTLRMDDCYRLDVLPQGMKNLISLRHLHYFSWKEEFKMPLEMGWLTSLQTLKFFNVGKESGGQIDQLGPLKLLKDKLEIRNLELVKGKAGAEQAELSGKQNLRELKFCWGPGFSPDADFSNDENVLDGLKPPENLKVLTIQNFNGNRLPDWLPTLSKLVKLELELQGFDKCKELPTLGHLPSLENLVLRMENVSCIGPSFYGLDDGRGGGGSSSFGDGQVAVSIKKLFPALKNLRLTIMKRLAKWEAAAVNDDVVVFPVLENLTIVCRSLISAPTHFPSLKRLKIDGTVQTSAVKNILSKVTGTLESLSFERMDRLTSLCDLRAGPTDTANGHFTSLKEFRVIACKGLVSMAKETLEGCTSLSVLEVSDCPNLISFPVDLQQTPSLSNVSLKKCPKLFTDENGMPRGFGHHTSLRRLSIGPFSTDDCSMELFDWSGLKSCSSTDGPMTRARAKRRRVSSTLRYLSLYGSPHMESVLPAEFRHFTDLKSLEFYDFGSIEALPDWLGNLASLEDLSLEDCKNLRYLPSMPALRRLTKLRRVQIRNCPLLEGTCRANSGPDSEWSKKISQLPNLKVYIR